MKNTIIAVCCIALTAGFAVEAANSNTFQQTPGASDQTRKKARVVDLTPLVRGQLFADGTHPVKTLENGEQISLVTRENRILEIARTAPDGHRHTTRPLRAVRSHSECTENADPAPGTHFECDDDCSTVGPKGTETVVCVQVPDGPEPPIENGNFPDSRAPVITGFDPPSGRVNTKVTITGKNFVKISEVSFNGTKATRVGPATANSFTAVVPLQATTGRISVTTATGTTDSKTLFTVLK
jgi:hypothetical protein